MEIIKELTKKPKDSEVVTVHLVRQADLNGAGRLFGGILMQWIDEVAGLVALRHTQMNVTTACVDNLQFLHGAYPNDRVVIVGKPVYVGNSSIIVKVETFVEKLKEDKKLINQAYLTLVGLDQNDKPTRIPRLIPETEEELKEWEFAKTTKTRK